MKRFLKPLLNRLVYNLAIGIFFGAALSQADGFGLALLICGLVMGYCIYR